MRADVADGAGRAAARGVGAPVGLLVAGALELAREPALVVFHDHLAQRAELARADHRARLPHHGVAGVVVGDAEDRALCRHAGDQRIGLLARVDQRLVAHHVEAGLDEGPRHRVVHMVGRDDRDEVDALAGRPLQFIGQQGLPIAMVARVGQAEVGARGARLGGIGGQRAGHELDLGVERDRLAVHAADEGIAAAADHGVAQLAMGGVGHPTP